MSSASENEREPGKIFVGGLSWDTSKESLSNYFQRFGKVTDSVIMKCPVTDKPRGFGFVTFADPKHVDTALEKNDHYLDGKKIDPKPATVKPPQPKKIFLGGIAAGTTEDQVRTFFEIFGPVADVDLKVDKSTERMKGFGFVTFEKHTSMVEACKEHFHIINNKSVEVKEAVTPRGPPVHNGQRPQANGYYGMYPNGHQHHRRQFHYPYGTGYGYDGGYQSGYSRQATGGYEAGSYHPYSQPSVQQQQQQGSSYPDPSYSNTYGSSRTADTSSYPAQQQQYHQPYSQGYGTSTGTAGYGHSSVQHQQTLYSSYPPVY